MSFIRFYAWTTAITCTVFGAILFYGLAFDHGVDTATCIEHYAVYGEDAGGTAACKRAAAADKSVGSWLVLAYRHLIGDAVTQ